MTLAPLRSAVTPDRLIFVAGLHRSGTTPLARWIAGHPQVAGLERTGVPQDEGQHLQHVYPRARDAGGPGRFAAMPRMHLTERDARPGQAERLLQAWVPYWDLTSERLVEKSPPNLLKLRWLQALFPGARFVAVIRHPVPVTLATARWERLPARAIAAPRLVAHWLAAHETLLCDASHIEHLLVVRFEDLVADPARQLDRVWEFLGLPPADVAPDADPGVDAVYHDRWRSGSPVARALARVTTRRFEDRVARFGYSLERHGERVEAAPDVSDLLDEARRRA